MTVSIRQDPTVCAVVVTFQPDPEALTELLLALLPQVTNIVIVDNSLPSNTIVEQLLHKLPPERITLIRLRENFGVAKGLNVGIEWARTQKADFVLLSDQDSLPAEDMVDGLLQSYQQVSQRSVTAAAIGPIFTDIHTGTVFPFQVDIPHKFFYGHSRPGAEQPEVEALTLITSGTLVPLPVLDEVGLMREEFFIDKVDIEWCLRAKAKGFAIYGTKRARMYQRLGERQLRVWFLSWRNMSAYNPTRVYYQVRNFFGLCRLPYISRRWKLRHAWFTFGAAYSQIVFGDQRLEATKMTLKGLWHGMCGRMGALRH
ncbi:glycosyltransferase family 2 protein [Dyella sp.]|uniref:glycosyltransferase family 2 protein n=1 Tax=Dyella sp. TaxID=1869338 RepID=UPI002FDA8485